MKRFVIGDIHGRFEALKQCLKRSKFDYKKDKLIVLGDVADGGYNTYEVVEELLKIDNVIYIIGNHDVWIIDWFKHGSTPNIWITQGGANTVRSYGGKVKDDGYVCDDAEIKVPGVVPVTHQDFFNRGVYYHVEDDNMVFVHGGFNPMVLLEKQKKFDLVWDRNLIRTAKNQYIYYNGNDIEKIDKKKFWKKVFVGHTTTQTISDWVHIKPTTPLNYNNLWCMDTGAGWNGRLCCMNIDTEEYWVSSLQKPAIR